jgi:hypothetical protein
MSDIEIPSGSDTRLLVRTWDVANGRRLVTVSPQHLAAPAPGAFSTAACRCYLRQPGN